MHLSVLESHWFLHLRSFVPFFSSAASDFALAAADVIRELTDTWGNLGIGRITNSIPLWSLCNNTIKTLALNTLNPKPETPLYSKP